jgi:hypothetical protein
LPYIDAPRRRFGAPPGRLQWRWRERVDDSDDERLHRPHRLDQRIVDVDDRPVEQRWADGGDDLR